MDICKVKSALKVSAMIIFFGSLFALSTSSCKHGNQYPKQTATMDSLSKILDSVNTAIKNVDSASIKKCVDHVIITMDYIKMYAKDKVSDSAAQILKSYDEAMWELRTFIGRQFVFKKEIPKSMEQLDHLSHDFKIDKISKDSAMIFYDFEVKKASELIEAARFGLMSIKVQVPLYRIITPQADSLIDRLKNHQKV